MAAYDNIQLRIIFFLSVFFENFATLLAGSRRSRIFPFHFNHCFSVGLSQYLFHTMFSREWNSSHWCWAWWNSLTYKSWAHAQPFAAPFALLPFHLVFCLPRSVLMQFHSIVLWSVYLPWCLRRKFTDFVVWDCITYIRHLPYYILPVFMDLLRIIFRSEKRASDYNLNAFECMHGCARVLCMLICKHFSAFILGLPSASKVFESFNTGVYNRYIYFGYNTRGEVWRKLRKPNKFSCFLFALWSYALLYCQKNCTKVLLQRCESDWNNEYGGCSLHIEETKSLEQWKRRRTT